MIENGIKKVVDKIYRVEQEKITYAQHTIFDLKK